MRKELIVLAILLSGIFVFTMPISGIAAIKNLVANPDFAKDITGWSISADLATLTIDKNEKVANGSAVLADVTKVGANAWEPEIHYAQIDLTNGKKYTLSFQAKADKARPIGAKFEQNTTWGGPSQDFNLTTSWAEYHFTPTMDIGSPPEFFIHIQFNGQTGKVWFSHFLVYEGDFVAEPLTSVTPIGRLATAWAEIKK